MSDCCKFTVHVAAVRTTQNHRETACVPENKSTTIIPTFFDERVLVLASWSNRLFLGVHAADFPSPMLIKLCLFEISQKRHLATTRPFAVDSFPSSLPLSCDSETDSCVNVCIRWHSKEDAASHSSDVCCGCCVLPTGSYGHQQVQLGRCFRLSRCHVSRFS